MGKDDFLSAAYWDSRWQQQQTGWDLGGPAPALTDYADQIPVEKRGLSILIPGCGNGYEAIYLLQNGFSNLTMLDISPTATEALCRRLDAVQPDWRQHLQVVCGDFFEYSGACELIFEQTFFCALHPGQRAAYVAQMAKLLQPEGKLVGVLFDRDFEGGPPFGGNQAEYRALFEGLFHLRTMASCYNSIPPRAGTELFVVFEVKKQQLP